MGPWKPFPAGALVSVESLWEAPVDWFPPPVPVELCWPPVVADADSVWLADAEGLTASALLTADDALGDGDEALGADEEALGVEIDCDDDDADAVVA